MCRGGTLPLRPTCSTNANRPPVSSPVARKVSSQPLYQTDCSRACRPLPNAMSSPAPVLPATCVAIVRVYELGLAATLNEGGCGRVRDRARGKGDGELG